MIILVYKWTLIPILCQEMHAFKFNNLCEDYWGVDSLPFRNIVATGPMAHALQLLIPMLAFSWIRKSNGLLLCYV